MDEKQAAAEFLRSLRGRRSQIALARQLGYTSNPITDWEAGRRMPTAAHALQICQTLGVDVVDALTRFAPEASAPLRVQGAAIDDSRLAAWLSALRGKRSITSLATAIDRSRSSVSRWLSGASRPQLNEFFQVVEAVTGRLCDLVAELVAIERVPTLYPRFLRRKRAQELSDTTPWAEAVLEATRLPDYQARPHSDAWLAQILGISDTDVQQAVAALLELGALEECGNRYQASTSIVLKPESLSQEAMHASHWARIAGGRSGHASALLQSKLVAISRESRDELQKILAKTQTRIDALLSKEQAHEELVQVSLQLLPLSTPR